jgi:gamma-glutamyltranspeptidase / glutathione hydrolase
VNAMIVCPQPAAAEAGLAVLRSGGNAVDAAVTTAFCQGVLDPQMCGVGGSGVMVVYRADTGRSEVIEFYARAGSGVTPGMWESIFLGESAERYNFKVEGDINDIGYSSIGVPGTVAGLALALRRHGHLSWHSALQPAIRLARFGFPVNGALHSLWTAVPSPGQIAMSRRLQATPASRELYTNDGAVKTPGELLVQHEYADTLETLANHGAESFYTGEIARRIALDFSLHGGFVTMEDLSNYRASVVEPLSGTYRGVRLVVPAPPAGGMTLIQMLNHLEGFDCSRYQWPSLAAAELRVASMGWAFADRQRYLADPEFTDVPVDRLIDKRYAAKRVDQLADKHIRHPVPPEPAHTTHVCVMDGAGNAVSLTHTLGASSGVVTSGLGFTYNNYLNCFDPRPGRPNSIQRGKTRITMMVPTILFNDSNDRVRAVVGAVGGTKIVTAVLHSLVNVLDHGMTPVEAVSAPRLDFQGDIIQAEGRIPTEIIRGLREHGYQVDHRRLNYDPYFGLAQLILVGDDGTLRGAADPRNDGGSPMTID